MLLIMYRHGVVGIDKIDIICSGQEMGTGKSGYGSIVRW
jgi:hypothetical protein